MERGGSTEDRVTCVGDAIGVVAGEGISFIVLLAFSVKIITSTRRWGT